MQDAGSKLELTHTEEIVPPVVQKRESKPSVQLSLLFLNTFRSSSKEAHKPKRGMFKIIIFDLRAYPFRLEVDSKLAEEAQQIFNEFISQGLKHRNK